MPGQAVVNKCGTAMVRNFQKAARHFNICSSNSEKSTGSSGPVCSLSDNKLALSLNSDSCSDYLVCIFTFGKHSSYLTLFYQIFVYVIVVRLLLLLFSQLKEIVYACPSSDKISHMVKEWSYLLYELGFYLHRLFWTAKRGGCCCFFVGINIRTEREYHPMVYYW